MKKFLFSLSLSLTFLFLFNYSLIAQTEVRGTFKTNQTWTKAGSPYILTGNITIAGADLSIESGVVVEMRSFNISVSWSSELVEVSPNKYERFYYGASLSANNVTFKGSLNLLPRIRYEGGQVNLNNYYAGGRLSNCTFENVRFGINKVSNPVIENSVIKYSENKDIAFDVSDGATPIIKNNQISGYDYCMRISDEALPEFSGNNIGGCKFNSILLYGNFRNNYTLPDFGYEYTLSNILYIWGSVFTIPDGLTINIPNHEIVITWTSVTGGPHYGASLSANNVTFKGSLNLLPRIRYEGGQVNLNNYYAGGRLSNCTFENVRFGINKVSNPVIENSVIKYSENKDIAFDVSGGATPIIKNNQISGYDYCMRISDEALPEFSGNNIGGCKFNSILLYGNFRNNYTLPDFGYEYTLSNILYIWGSVFTIPDGLTINIPNHEIVITWTSVTGGPHYGASLSANNVTFKGSLNLLPRIRYEGGQVNLNNYYAGGRLSNCTFENVRFGINKVSNPVIENSVIKYSENKDIAFDVSGGATPIIKNNQISGYDYCMRISDEALPEFSGNNIGGCKFNSILLYGNFRNNYTLPDFGYEYTLSNILYIWGSVFTIPDGLTINIPNHEIVITWTSVTGGPHYGASLSANNVTFKGSLNLLPRIRYEGGQVNLNNYYAGGRLSNCTFENVRFGINKVSNPVIENSVIKYSENKDIAFDVSGGATPIIKNNQISGYDYCMRISDEALPEFSGNNIGGCKFNSILLYGNFRNNYTLPDFGYEYTLSNILYIWGSVFTIPDGLTINIPNHEIVITWTSVTGGPHYGASLSANNVTFKGSLNLLPRIRYEGGQVNLNNYYAGGRLSNCTFENVRFGINKVSNPVIENSVIKYSENKDIAFDVSGGATPIIKNNQISGYDYCMRISDEALPEFSGNNIGGCKFNSILLYGNFRNNYTLPDFGYEYTLSNILYIRGSVFTIPDGLTINIPNHEIVITWTSVTGGPHYGASLSANNVTFKGSLNLLPRIRYEGGQVNLNNYYAGGRLSNCTFENVRFGINKVSNPVIENSVIKYSENKDIAFDVSDGATPTFENLQISGFETCIRITKNGKPIISKLDFYNCNFGINNQSNEVVNALNCYWGHSTGPNHATKNPNGKGCKVSDNVNFIPWATEPYGELPNQEVTEELYPVFKYHLRQDGSQGLLFGSSMLSAFSVATAGATEKILQELVKEVAKEALIITLEEILTEGMPKYITCCMKFEGNNLSDPNANYVFLIETEDRIKIGEPFKAAYTKYNYEGSSTLIPSDIGILIPDSYQLSPKPDNFYTVYEAGYIMKPGISKKNFLISTIGVVNGFIRLNSKNYMILQNYKPINYRLSTLIDMGFVAIDVTNQKNVPDIGSLVTIEGNVNKIPYPYLIKQSYESWYSVKVIQYIEPTKINIINGKITNELIYNTSLFSLFYNGEGKIVSLNFPGKSEYHPDFSFKQEKIAISPSDLFIKKGKNYNFSVNLENKGNIEGSCIVRAFINKENHCVEIGAVKVNSLKPNDSKLLQIPWVPNEDIPVFNGNVEVGFTITNSSPLEEKVMDNTITKELSLELSFLNAYFGINKLFVLTGYCPVSLKVTSPSGQIVDINANSIPNAEYLIDDFNGDGLLDTRIVLPELDEGEYIIEVIPVDGASQDDTYTLEFRINDEQIAFAKDEQIKNIPFYPYKYLVTSNKSIKDNKELIAYFIYNELIIENSNHYLGKLLIEIFDISGKLTYKSIHDASTQIKIKSDFNPINILRISNDSFTETIVLSKN
jgi:hypothetical protein